VRDGGVVDNLRLAAHGFAGMVIGVGHGLSQIPNGLAAAGRAIGELFTDPRQFAADLVRFRDALDLLWEDRDALWTAFARENPEKQSFLVGEFFGNIESQLLAMQAARSIGNNLPSQLGFTMPQASLGLAMDRGGAANLVVSISSRLVKLRLDAIKELIALGALDPAAAVAGVGTAGGVLMRQTPSGTVTPTAGPLRGRNIAYGDVGRDKHTKVAEYTQAQLNAARNVRNMRGNLKAFVRAILQKDTKYGGQLNRAAFDRYEELVRNALERGVQKGQNFYYEADFDIGTDIETGNATRLYRVMGSPAHIVPGW
jgi:hypothetical protein